MRTSWLSRAIWCALPSALVLPVAASAQDTLFVEYAVKFVCGRTTTTTSPVAPGDYFTAINVHNPRERTATFVWKLALTRQDTAIIGVPPTPVPGPISTFFNAELRADQALEVDCRHIVARAAPGGPRTRFFKGFVVFQARDELDVVAVYTAMGTTRRIETMDIERVEPRRIIRVP